MTNPPPADKKYCVARAAQALAPRVAPSIFKLTEFHNFSHFEFDCSKSVFQHDDTRSLQYMIFGEKP